MKEVRLQKRTVNWKDYALRYASDKDCSTVIDYPCAVYLNDETEPAIVYLEPEEKFGEIARYLRRVSFGKSARASGITTQSRPFGYSPPSALRQRLACNSAGLSVSDPEVETILHQYGRKMARYYEQNNPTRFATHLDQVANVLDEWRIPGTPFTSGIINKNSQLQYHYDRGNFEGCWSNMITCKHNVRGGNLACPEIDAIFHLKDGSLLLFDGQSLLHGVTPFVPHSKDAYRYTVVYYSLKLMWKCLPLTEEIARAQARRTEIEVERSKRRSATAREQA